MRSGRNHGTTAFADVVFFLEASFPTFPSIALDVADENLPLTGYLVGAFSIVYSLEAWLVFPVSWLLLAISGHGDASSCAI